MNTTTAATAALKTFRFGVELEVVGIGQDQARARAAVAREARKREAREQAALDRDRQRVTWAILHSLGRDLDPFPPRVWDEEEERWLEPGRGRFAC